MGKTISETIKSLKILEDRYQKKGYRGDATEYAFRRHTLVLLKDFKPIDIDKLLRRIEKLERDLDFYIKEYPEQLEKLKDSPVGE